MKDFLEPTVTVIPWLSEKIAFLLKELGRTQNWLANELGYVSDGRITQLKTASAVPNIKYKKFCSVLCVTPTELELNDLELFKKTVLEGLSNRSGSHWEAFVKARANTGLALEIVIPERTQPSPTISLKGLTHDPAPLSIRALRQPVVALGHRIDFFIPHKAVVLSDDIPVETYVLLLQLAATLEYIAPLSQPKPPDADSKGYKFTNADGEGFFVSEPPGQYQIYLLLLSDEIPIEITNDLTGKRAGRAADALAAWLDDNPRVHFSLHFERFFVSPT